MLVGGMMAVYSNIHDVEHLDVPTDGFGELARGVVSKAFRKLMAEGKMNEAQLVFFGDKKEPEELYDLANDPHEIHNLAADPKYKKELQRHRDLLAGWIKETGDQGQKVESDAGLLSTMKRWGDLCVNPEYDRVREQYQKWKASQPEPKPKAKGKGKPKKKAA